MQATPKQTPHIQAPPIQATRRQFFRTALLAPLATACAATSNARGRFSHGVASGDPDAESLLLWTRYLPDDGGSVTLEWQVARDAGFTQLLASGKTEASPTRDHCAKAIASSLPSDSIVHYRFRAPDGQISATGRGRTLPASGERAMTLAVFACANIGFGYFNAYAHAAARDDIDLLLHLGDYIYEHHFGTYPNAAQRPPGRDTLDPPHEIIALGDYRRRYAFYRADADLQALHARHSMMAIWDDHEFANDTWRQGAQNHQANEGPWEARRDAARQAYYEWLPIRDADVLYRQVKFGALADLILLDTRLIGRDRQASVPRELFTAAPDSAEYARAMARYRQQLHDPSRQMLGAAQEAWLDQVLAQSAQRGARWQIVAQQVLVGDRPTPPQLAGLLPSEASAALRLGLERRPLIAAQGLTTQPDSWPGYMAARTRLLASLARPGQHAVLLAGDTHNAWAYDHKIQGRHVAEFGTPGVCSPGLETSIPIAPATVAAAMRGANPDMVWCDTAHRGYMSLTVSRETARATWHLFDSIRHREAKASSESSLTARAEARGVTL
jgi:alkaline phosphatase D